MSPKQRFETYLASLNLGCYSVSFRHAITLALHANENAFTELPNWWSSDQNHPPNQKLCEMIKIAADGDRDPDVERVSVTINGRAAESASENRRKEILNNCINTVITDWTADRLGKHPDVMTEPPLYSVIAYPLPGKVGEQMNELIGLPRTYGSSHPRWQTLRSGLIELTATITNAGHITDAHVDNPGMQSDVYHIFGRKLWFLWEDSDENNEIMMKRTVAYDNIDLDWCYENLSGLKVCKSLWSG
jgi:hypothetical protein